MAEQQQWSSNVATNYNGGGGDEESGEQLTPTIITAPGAGAATVNTSTRSEHAVSNPIMVQGPGQYSLMSPKSVGEQSFRVHQMVENVLSSSPGSVTARGELKYVTGVGAVPSKLIKSVSSAKSSAVNGAGSTTGGGGKGGPFIPNEAMSPPTTTTTMISRPMHIPQMGGGGGHEGAGGIPMGATPEYNNYPFLIPNPSTPVVYTATSTTAQFGSTPTNYGYGSWGSVYPNGVADSLTALVRGTPPSSTFYSSSPTGLPPGSIFTMGYAHPQAPPPHHQQQQHQHQHQQQQGMNSLAGALSQMSMAGNAVHDPANGAINQYTQPHPHQMPTPQPQQQPYYMMTPPNASAFGPSSGIPPPNTGIFPPPGLQMYNPMQQALPYGCGMPSNLNGHRRPMMHNAHPNRALAGFDAEKGGQRSYLLDEFRNSRVQNLQLSHLGKHVLEFAKDQHGSRFIQQKLERASVKEKQAVFDEIFPHAHALIVDVFGNYVIQKLFEYGTPEQKRRLADTIKGNVVNFAMQMYGCRVIQRAMEVLDDQQQSDILKELEVHVLRCIKDQNGNHVVQKIIEKIAPTRLQFIIDAFFSSPTDTVCSLATHPYGCRVVQRILEHCTDEQKKPVLAQLHENTQTLIVDQYANYVLQHLIEHGTEEDRERIFEQVRGNVLSYASQKFASNVVECLLVHATPAQRGELIDEVCGADEMDAPPLLAMMRDPYANYTAQKMLDVADSGHRKQMMLTIKPHIPTLRKYSYGKHIIAKLERYFSKQPGAPFGQQMDYNAMMGGEFGNQQRPPSF